MLNFSFNFRRGHKIIVCTGAAEWPGEALRDYLVGEILTHVCSEIIMYSCNLTLIMLLYGNCRSPEEVDETLADK